MMRRVEIVIAACFYYCGLVQLVRWWKQRFQHSLIILCYHRATGGDLRQHLLYLRRHYRLLHLEAALEELYTPSKNRPPRRDRRTPLVLTFDDGYHDNYTHAFALARELQIPITIFLIPGYIESKSRFWWQESNHSEPHTQVGMATIEGCTCQLEKRTGSVAHAIDARVSHAKSVAERETFLTFARKTQTQSVSAIGEGEEQTMLPLTWVEVQAMAESGWISFGAHTMYHPILACLTDPAEVQYEVSECRVVLEQRLGHPVRTFAYPIGLPEHIGENGFRAVRKARYDWAVTTIPGGNTPRTDPYLLRRIVVDVDQHWLSVAAKASGVWGFFVFPYRVFIRKYLKRQY